jgi:hypothetical protein
LLTSCISYKGSDGKWITQSAFKPLARPETARINVHVMPSIDEACSQFGIVAACTTEGNHVYLKGKPQNVSMLIGKAYIDTLPLYDEGFTGDMLADKLGLELSFNARQYLGHEFKAHVLAYKLDSI